MSIDISTLVTTNAADSVTLIYTMTENLFIPWLTRSITERGWSIRETARHAGISHTVISNILNGDQPTFDTCVALSQVFREPPEYILRLAGLLPPPATPRSIAEERALYKITQLDDVEMIEQVAQYIDFIVELYKKSRDHLDRKQPPKTFREGMTPPEAFNNK
jgi:transcriptional regulator with XRE-family HTH domain